MPAHETTDAELRSRTRKFMRRPRPTGRIVGHKEGWVREFMALFDAECWAALSPPTTRQAFLAYFNLTFPRVSEFRMYLRVYDAAAAAGVNPWHLARTPIRTLYDLRAHLNHPNVLVRELLGEGSAAERQRVLRNARQRKRSRVKKQRSTVKMV